MAIPDTIKEQFVKLSETTECPHCGAPVELIGELRTNGNWYCPNCENVVEGNFNTTVPFTKFGLQRKKPLGSMLLGTAPPNFPLNLTTGFLVPSYSYKIVRKRQVLIQVTEDLTRTGRIKSDAKWAFELVFNNISKNEFDTLISFWEDQGYDQPFIYQDPFRGSSHTCYFDSEVATDTTSFDEVSCSVRITE